MSLLFLDYETFSSVSLSRRQSQPAAGVYAYTEAPDFEPLMAAWAFEDGDVQLAEGLEEILRIPGLFDPDVKKVAHNAEFERIVTSEILHRQSDVSCSYARSYRPPEEWIDTMALAAIHGYPQSLDGLTRALGAEAKDSAGTRLINLFCVPRRDGGRNDRASHPEEWAQFGDYCVQDVSSLRDAYARMPTYWPAREYEVWCADQRINDRGLKIDLALARSAKAQAAANHVTHKAELAQLLGIDNPGSVQQLRAGLAAHGLEVANLAADTVAGLLASGSQLTPVTQRALELRQELAGSASAKYDAALAQVSADGRLRGAFRYHGAHTARWTGRGAQPQNLPRAQLRLEPWQQALVKACPTKAEAEALEERLRVEAVEAAVADLSMGLPADADTLKSLVRGLFIGDFGIVDWGAIEARVLAWACGEQWVLDAFARGDDLYVVTASRMGPEYSRQNGKQAVLSLGYGGGVGALKNMGFSGTDEEAEAIKLAWREANANVVKTWRQAGRAFIYGGPIGDFITVEAERGIRRIRLPSGRAITYRGVTVKKVLKTWPNGDRSEVLEASYDTGRGRTSMWGGIIAENFTQAIARDILADSLLALEAEGIDVVGHVHDEIIAEGATSARMSEVMMRTPAWAPGLPLDGAGFEATRYRKG